MSKSEKLSGLAPIKNCPVCGKPLEKGLIIAPRGVYWDTKEHKYTILFSEMIITQWTWNVINVPSLKCTNCSIMIFSYGTALRTPEAYFKKCVKCSEKIPIASEYCPRCEAEQKEGVKP